MRLKISLFSLIISLFMTISSAFAQKTTITVRAKAKDAKFIGTSIGGAHIIIKNARTGEILAEGITSGSTGDTEKIMQSPHQRNDRLTDENTAGFTTELDLSKPVFATVEAYAPTLQKQATVKSSTQVWLIPGKDINDEGLVLDIPGFTVAILAPQTHERIASDQEIELRANVVMMCGCPTEPGGIWDANNYEVKALITGEEDFKKEVNLTFADKQSTFAAPVNLEPGLYNLTIYAYDPNTGNTGLDQTAFIVR